MPLFDTGVASYIIGRATVVVTFPVDFRGVPDVRCEQCQFLNRTGRSCQLNKQIVEYPEKYIGSHCPLKFEEE